MQLSDNPFLFNNDICKSYKSTLSLNIANDKNPQVVIDSFTLAHHFSNSGRGSHSLLLSKPNYNYPGEHPLFPDICMSRNILLKLCLHNLVDQSHSCSHHAPCMDIITAFANAYVIDHTAEPAGDSKPNPSLTQVYTVMRQSLEWHFVIH
jgi:hypothetical protein